MKSYPAIPPIPKATVDRIDAECALIGEAFHRGAGAISRAFDTMLASEEWTAAIARLSRVGEPVGEQLGEPNKRGSLSQP